MRWIVLTLGVLLVVAGLYLKWQSPENVPLQVVADSQTLRQTTSGPVVGGIAPAGSMAWLGIPYAASTANEGRWRAPRAPRRWMTPRETTRFGAVCPQFASALSSSNAEPGTLVGSEDCLYLNVFAPAGIQAGAELPVMFFIHGGGNTIGSAIPYDGSAFVQEQGVIMVTIHYRLGVLGWFSHPAVREAAVDPLDASGNFAVLDMIAALQWVQNNIAEFGGDAERVTVFGESAGGRNIYGLLGSPLAKGLFHGAIIQSGFPGTYLQSTAENRADASPPGHPNSSSELMLKWLQGAGQSRADAETSLAQLPGSEMMEYLRSQSMNLIMEPLQTPRGMYSSPALFRDGTVIPDTPLPELFADSDGWNRVPILAGTNRDEMKLFMALSDRHVTRRFGVFPAPTDPERYNLLSRYHSDSWKAAGVDLPLGVISSADPELPLYAYRFDWDDQRSNMLVNLPELLGAAHAMELDFLFGPLIARVVPGVFHSGNEETREALARSIRDYWAGFAYSGAPGSGRSASQPAWPRWTADDPRVMLLDEVGDGGVRPETVSVTVESMKEAIASETALPERIRCAVYVDTYLGNSGLPELFDAREYQEMGCGQFPAMSLIGRSR